MVPDRTAILSSRWSSAALAEMLQGTEVLGLDFWGASGDAPSILQMNYWAMNEDSILLEQCWQLDKRDLRIFEAYCGSVGGWTRSTS